MQHLTLDAHVLPDHPWPRALDEALTIAKKLRCAVTLHAGAREITVLPSTTRADVARVEAQRHPA